MLNLSSSFSDFNGISVKFLTNICYSLLFKKLKGLFICRYVGNWNFVAIKLAWNRDD